MSKSCIYCGKKGNKSKEHLWPVWMHEYLPSVGDGSHVRESNTFQWKQPINEKQLKRQGNLFTLKLRVVCKTCNSGWMSKLEEDVKPIMVSLIKGENISLQKADQELLSRWISMKVIIGEHAEKGIHVTPKNDRHLLREEQKIPEYFSISICTHDSNSDTAWLRTSNTLALSPNGPNPSLGHLKRNSQSVSFICGRLFIFVFSSREKGIVSSEFITMNSLKPIYPQELENISWPTTKLVTEREMGKLAWALNDIHKLPNVSYCGNLP